MAEDHVVRQAEREAELAHLVLEQLAQRLEQLQVQRLRQAADVVVRLDVHRLLGLRAGRLDHVRIDRALREPLRVVDLRRLALEHFDEQPADDLALLLGIGDAFERADRTRPQRRRGSTFTCMCFANVSITCCASFSRSSP